MPTLSKYHVDYIKLNGHRHTIAELMEMTGGTYHQITNFLMDRNIKPVSGAKPKPKPVPKPANVERLAPEYSNTDWTKKYL